MKIKNTRNIQRRIQYYSERRKLNTVIGITLFYPLSVGEIVFDEPAKLLSFANQFQNEMARDKIYYTEDQAIVASMVMNVLGGSIYGCEIFPPSVLDEIFRNSHVFHKGELENNPYYKNIHLEPQKTGKFEIKENFLKKYELFMYDTAKDRFQGIMIPAIGTTDHRFKFPNILENGTVWMSITPNEIYTMKKPISEASGKVLTLGCGMGYFAYMAALKDDVESVTIVEREQDVIDLFTNFILPQFSCKNKINIVHADAFDYMEELADGEYDYCFADIWRGNNDTVPYLKMKKLCSRFHKTTVSYWIEDALISTIMGYVYSIMQEELHNIPKFDDLKIIGFPEDEKIKLDFLRDLLKNKEISKAEDVDYFMDFRNIVNLIE